MELPIATALSAELSEEFAVRAEDLDSVVVGICDNYDLLVHRHAAWPHQQAIRIALRPKFEEQVGFFIQYLQ